MWIQKMEEKVTVVGLKCDITAAFLLPESLVTIQNSCVHKRYGVIRTFMNLP